jgi:hypothetical protein
VERSAATDLRVAKGARRYRMAWRVPSLGGSAFLAALAALVLSSCTTGYTQCLHNGGGAFRCTVSSGQINQKAKANILASCSAGDEDVCRKGCGQTRDAEICEMWFAIKCPQDPSICQSACRLSHDRVACRGACEAGDQAACADYFQTVQ